MDSLPASLQRVVRSSRWAACAEAACLGIAAFTLVGIASLADGFSPWSAGPAFAAASAFAATTAAFLRANWKSDEFALRRADRVSGGGDRWATRHALHARRETPGILDALCEAESERWVERHGAPSWRQFVRTKIFFAPLCGIASFAILASNPGLVWRAEMGDGELRAAMAEISRDMLREGGEEGARLAKRMDAIGESLRDDRAAAESLRQMRRLHEEMLRQGAPFPASAGPSTAPALSSRALEALEKGMIAISRRLGEEAGSASGDSPKAARLPGGDGSPSGSGREDPSSAFVPSADSGVVQVSASYEIPARFDSVVRRYFALIEREPR